MTELNPRMPVVFFGHGSPMNALEDNRYSRAWRRLGERLPRPRAILAISAHWLTRGSAVTAVTHPRTIHDFGGFPRELYEVEYPAPGDPALADRVAKVLAPALVSRDMAWGLDHGTWSVLMHAYPDAAVPVIQLSLDATLPFEAHYELGRRLAPLREEGILIAGSGNVVHNLGLMVREAGSPAPEWARLFEERIRTALLEADRETLTNIDRLGNAARLSVPTPEHYLPLLYVAALRAEAEPIEFPVEGIEHASLSMLSVLIGEAGATR